MEKNIVLRLEDVSFRYGGKNTAVSHVTLDVEEGSFTTLLGPSGCGKTTLLNLIAGFLSPTEGRILLSGVDQKDIPPEKRRIGVVFQDYALFPHLTVRENILYGLKIRKELSKPAMEAAVEDMAESLGIGDFLSRHPHELSGGQQQRVALARALVLKPSVLLMDEPLSSLDAKLRIRVREELKEIQERYHMTTIYVTHDQEEALSLSDEVVVLEKGVVLQTGSPEEVYFSPKDKFTADFVGRANFLVLDGKEYLVRPDWFSVAGPGVGDISGTVVSVSFLGEKLRTKVKVGGETVVVDLPTVAALSLEKGEPISLSILRKVSL